MYGTVRTVVWEDGGRNPASYPIRQAWRGARVARKVEDKRVLRLIRRYLQAGVMAEGAAISQRLSYVIRQPH